MNSTKRVSVGPRLIQRVYMSVGLVAAVFVIQPAALAVPITVPMGLGPSDQYRLAFVTSSLRYDNSTNIADYNAFVTTAANSVPELSALATTWYAIGSTSTVDARDNTFTNPFSSVGVPIFRLDDVKIASSNADLWDGSLLAPLNVTELNSLRGNVNTGTTASGVVHPGAGFGGAIGWIGDAYDIGSRWIDWLPYNRVSPYSIYAISGLLTVPGGWNNPSGGEFQTATNWLEGTKPTLVHTAQFNLSATYTVTFASSQANDRLLVRQGDVTFDLGGSTYDLVSTAQDSVRIANESIGVASLTLGNGVLSAVNSSVGLDPRSSGEVAVGAGAIWTSSGNVQVGGGTGLVTVNPSGTVNVGGTLTARVGGTVTLAGGILHAPTFNVAGGTFNLNSGALQLTGGLLSISGGGQFNGAFDVENGDSVSVSGAGSAWHNPSSVRVGGAGLGDISVSTGASVTSTTMRIGFAAGSEGSVTVAGAGSTWESSEGIEVGSEVGKGTLAASSGGHVTTGYVSIGELSGSVGTMSVTGNGSSANLSDKLEVGVIGTGTLEVLSGGTVTAASAVITRDGGSSGTGTINGVGSVLNVGGDLFVGKGGTAILQVTGGGRVTNVASRIGFSPGSHGAVTVTGSGSLWQNTDGIELGSEVGAGELIVADSGRVESTTFTLGELVSAHGKATVSGGSTVALSDKLELGVLGVGELHVLAGGTVSAPTAEFARDGSSTGTAEVTGAGAMLSTTGAMYVGGNAVATGGTGTLAITNGGNVAVGTQLKVWQNGSITVNGGSLNYATLEIAGGVLSQATIDTTNRAVAGFGTLNGNVTGNGTVTASGGTLTLGNAGSTVGVGLTGSLAIAPNAHAVLLDTDRAELGTTTALAPGSQLSAPNGFSLGSGEALTATGSATVQGAFTNGGIVNGPAAVGSQLTLSGDVDGPGSFTGNIKFSGQLTPGTSLAPVVVAGNASFASTATMRLLVSGAIVSAPGAVVVSGEVALGGKLDVDLFSGIHPALGSSFTVMTFGSRAGDFTSYVDTSLGGHLTLRPQFTPNSLVLRARPVQEGDINLDGTVNIFDVNAVSSNWNTAGPQGDANGDGAVNIFDVNVISTNWGETEANATAVPEPAAMTLLLLGLLGVAISHRFRFDNKMERKCE